MRTFVFSGPPGAGKTSLILALLARLVPDGWKIAVLENDAASQPLDARRLSGSGALVREIAAGCVCCSFAGDFALAVRELSAYEKPDFLLIEPSGIAAPQLVKQALTGLKEVTSLNCFVLLDASGWRALIRRMEFFVRGSLEAAEAALLTKCDRVDEAELGAAALKIGEWRRGLPARPVSCENGEGLDALAAFLVSGRGGFPAPGREGSRTPRWRGGIYSRRIARVFAQPLSPEGVRGWLAGFCERLASDIAQNSGMEVVGHLKAMAESGREAVFANLDSFPGTAVLSGGLTRPAPELAVTINVLAGGLDDAWLKKRLDSWLDGRAMVSA